ncbi:MAG TPA: diaminopimelate decarboxylase [Chloroflexia bacterium]|nr:diaminopimelate decarboxylase [Chloroflexia bacterium]
MDPTTMPDALDYRNGLLHIDGVPATTLAARFGTPLYAYSARVLRNRYLALENAMRGVAPRVLLCYALKANNNPALGGLLASMGAGADVVSGGELYLALRMGFAPERIVFAGVGKTAREMAEGLEAGIRAFHVESAAELSALERVAASMGKAAPVAVRVNPDVDAGTHPHITTGTRANKFGVEPELALALVRQAAASQHLEPVGLHAHVGSQLLRVAPIVEAARRLLDLWEGLAAEGIALRELDIGGGLGIRYRPEDDPEGPEQLAASLRPLLAGRDLDLVMEPGRYIAGPAGVLLTTVTYVKTLPGEHVLAVVDAGMNDLLRPALYDAYHPVYPVREAHAGEGPVLDVVGPVCESADVPARGRRLGLVVEGDVLAIGQAGAYGFSMASQYNARPRPAEVLVDGGEVRLIRERETYADLWAGAPK